MSACSHSLTMAWLGIILEASTCLSTKFVQMCVQSYYRSRGLFGHNSKLYTSDRRSWAKQILPLLGRRRNLRTSFGQAEQHAWGATRTPKIAGRIVWNPREPLMVVETQVWLPLDRYHQTQKVLETCLRQALLLRQSLKKNTDEDRLARALLYYTYSDITIEDDFNRLSSIPRKYCRHCSSNPIAAVSHRCTLTTWLATESYSKLHFFVVVF